MEDRGVMGILDGEIDEGLQEGCGKNGCRAGAFHAHPGDDQANTSHP
jgi:hypothetical protein